MQITKNRLGKYLEQLRIEKRYSLRYVTEITGVSHAYVRDLELSHNRSTGLAISPSPQILRKLAFAYGVDYRELYKMADILDTPEDIEDNTLFYMGIKFELDDKEARYLYDSLINLRKFLSEGIDAHDQENA